MQGYWLYIVMRDNLITLTHFTRDDRSAFAVVLIAHYFLSCFDNLIMSGITIWATYALSEPETSDFAFQEEASGMPKFLAVTTLNVVMAYLYVFAHVVACPITICLVARNPEAYGMSVRQPEEWDDDQLDSFHNQEYAEQIRA